ncbi:MAG: SDR family NAD(P)-dependent oxidoreductase [Solirubrobacteraceae bacterium]
MSLAIITGASRGLGRALVGTLAQQGWALVIDARRAGELEAARRELAQLTEVTAIVGDVADAGHRRALIAAAGDQVDLLVNNASSLGPDGRAALSSLASYPLDEFERVYAVNVAAPLALIQLALPRMPDGSVIVNVSSDAAVEAYDGWGGYGSSKAALEQLTAVLGAEHPALRIYAVDPGDMRTEMHQRAFPGEDISDRPLPEESVPGLLALIEGELPSGRYRARSSALTASAA